MRRRFSAEYKRGPWRKKPPGLHLGATGELRAPKQGAWNPAFRFTFAPAQEGDASALGPNNILPPPPVAPNRKTSRSRESGDETDKRDGNILSLRAPIRQTGHRSCNRSSAQAPAHGLQ
jgi:hypothetical protein